MGRGENIFLNVFVHLKPFIKSKREYRSTFLRRGGDRGLEGKENVVKDGDVMHFRFNI